MSLIENKEFQDAFVKWVIDTNNIITKDDYPLEFLTPRPNIPLTEDDKWEWKVLGTKPI